MSYVAQNVPGTGSQEHHPILSCVTHCGAIEGWVRLVVTVREGLCFLRKRTAHDLPLHDKDKYTHSKYNSN